LYEFLASLSLPFCLALTSYILSSFW